MLVHKMEKELQTLSEGFNFNPASHPCAQQLAKVLGEGGRGGGEEEEEEVDEDLLVGEVYILYIHSVAVLRDIYIYKNRI